MIIFFVFCFVVSGVTTSLMAWRIWRTDRAAVAYRASSNKSLMPFLRILIESAALQFLGEGILLILYAANFNAQYLVVEPMTNLVVR